MNELPDLATENTGFGEEEFLSARVIAVGGE
jgi:hypothetical protein